MKKQGVLIYDDVIGRMDIRFGPLDYYGGLHCGERLEVLLVSQGRETDQAERTDRKNRRLILCDDGKVVFFIF